MGAEPEKARRRRTMTILMVAFLLFIAIPLAVLGTMLVVNLDDYTVEYRTKESREVLAQMEEAAVTHGEEHCELPPQMPRTASMEACSGGEVCPRDLEAAMPEYWQESVDFPQESYFSYSAIIEGNDVVLRGESDFVPGEPFHTIQQRLTLGRDCSMSAGEVEVLNQFQ